MALNMIGGAGVGLPLPQSAYNNVGLGSTNTVVLAPGQAMLVPAGNYVFIPGPYTFLQYLDPITGYWSFFSQNYPHSPMVVNSDGYNYRVVNPSGCPIGAMVRAVGSGYNAATTVVTASAGGSTWVPIIGGSVNTSVTISTNTTTNLNSGYTLAPIVVFPSPPTGGIPAAGYATVSGGAVSSIVVTSTGAGYLSAPTPILLPNQYETSTTISPPLLTCTLSNTGAITGILCTNPGTPVTSVPTLSISGAGAGAQADALMAFSVTAVSVTTAGAGIPGVVVDIVGILGSDQNTNASPNLNWGSPSSLFNRPANIYCPLSSGALGTPVILDGGLYLEIPNSFILQQSGTAASTGPVVSFTMGGTASPFWLQPI